MKSYIYEENGDWFDTLDENLAKEKNASPGYKIITNDLNEVLSFYSKTIPVDKWPLFIHAILWGQENNLTIPTVFSLETTVKNHCRITDAFDVFYENYIDKCWNNL